MIVVLNNNETVSVTDHGTHKRLFFFKANKAILVASNVALSIDVLTKLSKVV